jgi:hypothetical protein
MRIPPYWANESHDGLDRQGEKQEFWAWGWSFDSLTEASQEAKARAKRVFDAFTSGKKPDTYAYHEHPLREEIVDSMGPKDDETAIITRNRYGALVLNCSSICFVDVDYPAVNPTGFFDALRLLFSAQRRREKASAIHQVALEQIRAWSQSHPDRCFRLYQTAAGLRLLFIDRRYDPVSEETAELLKELGSDPLYATLTLKQQCFRARLTPKPWRCRCSIPPNRYPWETADAERKYRTWQQTYERKSKSYGICRFLETLGNSPSDEAIGSIVRLHDKYTCCADCTELA